jgi:4-amino-4-deoxy-L-arabinose transferase-like glycosyltransferase
LGRQERAFLVCACVALLSLRVVAMFTLPLTDTTEARYAEIARIMVESGDWITPQFSEGVPFWGKPPLHTWLAAGAMKVFGIGEASARLPILIVSLGILWLAYRWMRIRRTADHALLAVAVLASSLLFWGASAFVMTDMVMTLGTTLSMIGFYQATRPERPASVFWGYGFFIGLAIGLLAKGPVAVVLTGIPVFLWIIAGRRWHLLARLPWVPGSLLCLALALPWYVAAELKTPGFISYFILGEHFHRFLESGWQGDLYGSGHARPMGTIGLYWLGALFPWSLFMPMLLVRYKGLKSAFSSDSEGWLAYLAFWSMSPVLLFLFAANIVPAYVLPGMLPAALLFVALGTDLFREARRMLRILFGSSIGLVAAIALALIATSDISPGTLNLKTARELVYQARKADPDIRVHYWGHRSFSADFYTRGQVAYLSTEEGLRELAADGVPDALALRSRDTDLIDKRLLSDFVPVGTYGRYTLFVENYNGEAGP